LALSNDEYTGRGNFNTFEWLSRPAESIRERLQVLVNKGTCLRDPEMT
jgi:hypothetical protein